MNGTIDTGRIMWIAPLGLAAAVAAPLVAQSTTNSQLTPVEQVVGDTDPLRTSLRSPAGTLQQDANFEHVYAGPDGKLYRVSGALYAQFERSIYVPSAWGVTPIVPPGTTYYIGAPPSLQVAPNPSRERPAEMIDDRIDTRVDWSMLGDGQRPVRTERPHDEPANLDEPPDAGTMSHEPTRQRRLAEIAESFRARTSGSK